MKNNFSVCLKHVLKWEGGYSNHPSDPGESTNKGVTQATYDAYLVREPHHRANVSVKNISDVEVEEIYRTMFWDKVEGDLLPPGLDLAVFDFAVNSGPARAARYLQRLVSAKQDGRIGPKTLQAVSRNDPPVLINHLCDDRLSFVQSLPKRLRDSFLRGWTRRIKSIRKASLKMTNLPSVSLISIIIRFIRSWF